MLLHKTPEHALDFQHSSFTHNLLKKLMSFLIKEMEAFFKVVKRSPNFHNLQSFSKNCSGVHLLTLGSTINLYILGDGAVS